jgi:hypothetical protein
MPGATEVCESLWIQNPSELLKASFAVVSICESNNINAFSRASLIALFIAAVLFPWFGFTGLAIVLVCLVILYGRWIFAKINTEQRISEKEDRPGKKEGFLAYEGVPIRPDMKDQGAFATAPVTLTSPGVVTRPTAVNPFMNVLLDEITYNPTRPSADFASDPNNQAVLDDFFRVQWTSDPTDVFGRAQSQREFYTMPSTSIPNDQESYQNWLYLIPGKTCKEGGRDACYPATNGSPIVSLSQPN